MRLISQDWRHDIPYENTWLEIMQSVDEKWRVFAGDVVMGIYMAEAEATNAVKALLGALQGEEAWYVFPEDDASAPVCAGEGQESSILDKGIEILDLGRRPYNVLKRGGVDTIRQVAELGEHGLLRLRKMGPKTCEEIRDAMIHVGAWERR